MDIHQTARLQHKHNPEHRRSSVLPGSLTRLGKEIGREIGKEIGVSGLRTSGLERRRRNEQRKSLLVTETLESNGNANVVNMGVIGGKRLKLCLDNFNNSLLLPFLRKKIRVFCLSPKAHKD